MIDLTGLVPATVGMRRHNGHGVQADGTAYWFPE